MKIISANTMREIDRIAIDERGIPSLDLMESAGAGIAERVLDLLGRAKGRNVSIFCGKGNNGGDGMVVARYLAESEVIVKVFLVADPKELSPDAHANLTRLPDKVAVINIAKNDDLSEIREQLPSEDVIVDALLGTGATGPVNTEYARIIELINSASGAQIVSVDIPSGVEGDSGRIGNIAVWADHTITLGMPKLGLYLQPGNQHAGTISVVDIGIPTDVIESFPLNYNVIDEIEAKMILPPRRGISHKGDYGKVLLIGGSRGMAGSMALAAESVLRSGAGMVVAATPKNVQKTLAIKLAEVMTLPLSENSKGTLTPDSAIELEERLEWADVVAIGPGLGFNDDTIAFMENFMKMCKHPCVIDADGIKCFAKVRDKIGQLKNPIILTPHPGELAFFLGMEHEKVLNNYFQISLDAAKKHNITLLLKVHRSVTASPDGRATINITGNSGMASAGSGDVLTGILAGFLAQGANPFDSARLGAYIHGLAGDMAAKELGEYSMVAGDIIKHLPNAFQQIVCGE